MFKINDKYFDEHSHRRFEIPHYHYYYIRSIELNNDIKRDFFIRHTYYNFNNITPNVFNKYFMQEMISTLIKTGLCQNVEEAVNKILKEVEHYANKSEENQN